MDNKQAVQDLLQRDSNGASPSDVAQETEFIAAVRVGLDELDVPRDPDIPPSMLCAWHEMN
jgi:hypothetical protein